MDNDELVLSDVHLNKETGDRSQVQYTRFFFTCAKSATAGDEQSRLAIEDEIDEDGDFVVPSLRDNGDRDVIGVHHEMMTTLDEVGKQLWRGALLMGDYVLENRDSFADKRVLELGSGLGFVGAVLGQFAKSVTCTDVGADVLALCRRNLEANSRLTKPSCAVDVLELDWLSVSSRAAAKSFLRGAFGERVPEVLVACDCVYDCDLTEALFRTIYYLSLALTEPNDGWPSIVTYVSLEKRLNFTLSDLDVACPEYDHFRSCLNDLQSTNERFCVSDISITSLPKYFEYDRVEQLEIWQIECHVRDS